MIWFLVFLFEYVLELFVLVGILNVYVFDVDGVVVGVV